MPQAKPPAKDVLSPAGNTLMACLWLCLFAGRWILPILLEGAGLCTQQQVAAFDQLVFERVYLILICITVLVVALRAVRSAGSPAGAAKSADSTERST